MRYKFLTNYRDGVIVQIPSPVVICPPSLQQMALSDIPSNPATLILPSVIVWNPMLQFPTLKQSLNKCPQDNCGSVLQFYTWTNGEREGMQPRLIHSLQSMVLLVGAVYRCSQDHIVYSTDASLLQRLARVQINIDTIVRRAIISIHYLNLSCQNLKQLPRVLYLHLLESLVSQISLTQFKVSSQNSLHRIHITFSPFQK